MSRICVMPAKGHSSRLPGKNKKLLLGHPLFYYGLKAAVESECFQDIFISTDDPEIAEIAGRIKGIKIDIRPEYIRGDNFSAPEVIAELVNRLGGERGYNLVCAINACCPLVRPFHLQEAVEAFEKSQALVLESVVRSRFNPDYSYRIKDGFLQKQWNQKRIQSNNMEPVYSGNGSFVIIRTDMLIKEKTFFLEPALPYVMDDIFSFDIDTPEDFHIVEAQMRRLIQTNELTIS